MWGSSCESGLRPSQLWSASQLLPGTRSSFRRSRELPPAVTPGPRVLCSSLEVSQAERSLLLKCGSRRREGSHLPGCTLGGGEPQRPSPLLPRSPPGGRDTPWPFLDGRASAQAGTFPDSGGQADFTAGQGCRSSMSSGTYNKAQRRATLHSHRNPESQTRPCHAPA